MAKNLASPSVSVRTCPAMRREPPHLALIQSMWPGPAPQRRPHDSAGEWRGPDAGRAGPDQAAVAERQREQPYDARGGGLIGDDHLELGKVDLGLSAGRGLEAAFEGGWRCGADLAQEVRDSGVAAAIAALLDLAEKARAGQARKVADAIPA